VQSPASDVAGVVPVERLQIDLNGCFDAGLQVDGEYGPATTQAVEAVQAWEGVPVDGDYGPETIEGTGTRSFRYLRPGGSLGDCDEIVF
jgi:peptidoglycan hydrolase-like protein with peptidoglycan-binding domain